MKILFLYRMNVGSVVNVLEVHTASIFKVIPEAICTSETQAKQPTSTKCKCTTTNSASIMNHLESLKSIIQQILRLQGEQGVCYHRCLQYLSEGVFTEVYHRIHSQYMQYT
jgi:hypothetical protein